ncbi:MAG TPA: histidine phosphatase family protein [Acidimicrobiales bacterium]
MLILIRHGESTGNADGLLLGRLDAPLTERGLAQARTLGPSVTGASRIISSPLARARVTAEALGTGLPVEIDERWIEVDYGEFDGRPLGAVPAEVWARWRKDPDFRPPGGETLAEAGTRVRSACEELFATEGEGARGPGPVVVVSHVSPIKAAACWAVGLGDEGAWRLHLATASVTRVTWGVDGPVLSRFNETPWSTTERQGTGEVAPLNPGGGSRHRP